MTQGKIDPADRASEQREKERQEQEMKKFDITQVSFSDFERIPKKRARFIHPFEGYPLKPPLQISKDVSVTRTFIVALDPRSEPDQDPSGLRTSIVNTKTKKEEIKDLKTYHSRFLKDSSGTNVDVVFDRELDVDGKIVHYAVIPDHATRARVCYYYDAKLERFEVDNRYMLLDTAQAANLMRLFQSLMRPALRREQMAAMVAGDVETTDSDLERLPTEA